MSYKAPGVYVQDVVSGSQSITQASSSVGVLIGVTRSGVVGVAQKIESWTEFIAKYANGLDTPFLENSYLPYAVHGFFTNGGKELYIGSVKKGAVKATATGGTNAITVTASETALYTQIEVEDTGTGFDSKDIPHLFERFYKGTNASENSYGIGLALARTVITAQNGTVQAMNGEAGAKFVIKFYKQVI